MNKPESYNEAQNVNFETILVFALAIGAAIMIKLPAFFGYDLDLNEGFYFRNFSLFVLPFLAGYFGWKRQMNTRNIFWISLAFIGAALFANLYPFQEGGSTEILVTLHLPILLWLIVGFAFTGTGWNLMQGRMDFIRFTGEFFVYYALIALGGGVFMGFMALIFSTIEIDIEPFFESWILPCGVVGAVIIASWLVETKKGFTGNLAPMLSRLFSPFFTIMVITFLGTLIWTGHGLNIERDVLIAFDMLLVVVLGLMLYSISSRNPQSPPGIFDYIQILLIVSALLADAVALWAIAGRITEFGFTPNRVAALGLNIILLVNLVWSAKLYFRFLGGHISFSVLEHWQTQYIPVYAGWAAIVVIIFPPLFGFS